MQENRNPNLEQFRDALQREFLERSKVNASYSLRTYAKSLGIDQSFLSKVLKGNRPVTPKLVDKLAPKLRLRPTQIQELFTTGTNTMPGFLSMTDDQFDLQSEWYHSAILELAKTQNFEANPAKIATRLGIHVEKVRAALSRLERLGIIRITNGQIEEVSSPETPEESSVSNEARRLLQKELISKSLEAIEETPAHLRENSSLTIAINKKNLPAFKKKIEMIQKELAEFFVAESEMSKDEVYQLTLALFPLTKIKENAGEI